MAITFQFGDAFGSPKQLDLKPWKYDSAFRIVTDNGQQARMTDILAPLDKQTSVKVTLSKIANVYSTLADGNVPVAEQNANVTGATVFCELKTIATKVVEDQTIQVPLVSRIELRIPFDGDITDSDVQTLIMANLAALCDETGNLTVISEKLRGALTPAGI